MESTEPLQDIMCEFRAGKMFLEGTRVIPDTREGLVRIGRGEEGLVHFQWLDRGQNIVVDDQIVFPDEAVFEKVTESSGRVYILKFRHDSRKFFVWMQEANADGDSQICRQVNAYINRPLDGEAVSIEAEMSQEDTADDDISSRAGNLVDQSVISDLAGEVTSAGGPVRLEDLQRILSAIQLSDATADPDAGLGLGDILKPDLVLPLVETLPIEQLATYLPEGSWTASDILELLQSPPLRQQVDAFTHVLRTGQIDLAQFGVDPSKYGEAVSIEAEMSQEDTADDDISSRAGNLVDQSVTSDLAGEVTSAGGPVRLEDLQRILSAIQLSDATADPDAGLGLGDILKPDLVLPLVETLPIEQLATYLPEGSWTASDILELLQSPPLRQQVDAFTHVLRTGQIDLAQFGVDPNKFTVASFLEALEDYVAKASTAGDKDSQSQRGTGGGNDPMDES